jgi:hypothetical protein
MGNVEKRLTVGSGIVVAFLLAVGGGAVSWMLGHSLGPRNTAFISVAGLTISYLLYLLGRRSKRVGGITLIAIAAISLIATIMYFGTIVTLLLTCLFLIWIFRAAISYQSLLLAGMDGALIILGGWLASVTLSTTNSFGVAVWVFFLTQSLVAFIPTSLAKHAAKEKDYSDRTRFERAYQSARTAMLQAPPMK